MNREWNYYLNAYLKTRLNNIDWFADWEDEDQLKFYIIYDHCDKEFLISQDVNIQIPGVVYLPQDLAEEMMKMNKVLFKLAGE